MAIKGGVRGRLVRVVVDLESFAPYPVNSNPARDFWILKNQKLPWKPI